MQVERGLNKLILCLFFTRSKIWKETVYESYDYDDMNKLYLGICYKMQTPVDSNTW